LQPGEEEKEKMIVRENAFQHEKLGLIMIRLLCEKRCFYSITRAKKGIKSTYTLYPLKFSKTIINETVDRLRSTTLCGPHGGQLVVDW